MTIKKWFSKHHSSLYVLSGQYIPASASAVKTEENLLFP